MGRPKLPRDKDGNIIREAQPEVIVPVVPEVVPVAVSPMEVNFSAGSLSLSGSGLTIREAIDDLVRASLPRRRFAMISVSYKEKKGRPIVIKPFQLRFLWRKPEMREWFANRLSTTL